jgi:hypothetical protein
VSVYCFVQMLYCQSSSKPSLQKWENIFIKSVPNCWEKYCLSESTSYMDFVGLWRLEISGRFWANRLLKYFQTKICGNSLCTEMVNQLRRLNCFQSTWKL